MVIWIERHVVGVVFFGDVAGVSGARQIEEQVGEEDGDGDCELGGGG